MQIIAMAVPAQEGITRDNVSVRVDAVVYFRVVDPIKAVVNVQNYMFAVSQQAQTSLRSIIGQSEMDQLLAERDTVNRELRRIIDEPTEGPWGIRVERVEIKDVNLPEGMKRSMSRQAEAERERRARIITADGEYQASKRLAAAANVMARDPAALQLRLLQTVVEVAGGTQQHAGHAGSGRAAPVLRQVRARAATAGGRAAARGHRRGRAGCGRGGREVGRADAGSIARSPKCRPRSTACPNCREIAAGNGPEPAEAADPGTDAPAAADRGKSCPAASWAHAADVGRSTGRSKAPSTACRWKRARVSEPAEAAPSRSTGSPRDGEAGSREAAAADRAGPAGAGRRPDPRA